jgi:hypothetical protein
MGNYRGNIVTGAPPIYERMPGLGEGISAVANVLGNVLNQRSDQQLLDQTLEEAKAKSQTGDMSGLVDILNKAKSPQTKEGISRLIQTAPQQYYQQKEGGGFEQAGTIPYGGKLLEPDKQAEIAKRQAEHDERAAKTSQEHDERIHARTQLSEDRKDQRATNGQIFTNQMQTRREDHSLLLKKLELEGADKKTMKAASGKLFEDYQRDVKSRRGMAAAELKAIGSPLTNSNFREDMKDINDKLNQDLDEMDDSYGKIAEGYGYKIPLPTKKRYKGYEKEGVSGAGVGGEEKKSGWHGPGYYRGKNGERTAIRTEEDYNKAFK